MLLNLLKALRVSRRESRVRRLLARGLESQKRGDLRAAIQFYREAVVLDPRHLDALCLAGNALTLAGHLDQASDTLRLAVAADPQSVEAHLLLASALPLPECRLELVATLRRLLELREDDADQRLNYRLAMALRDGGDHAEAIRHLSRALEIHEDAPHLDIHGKLANLLHAGRQAEEARHHYEQAWRVTGNDGMRLKRVTIVPPVPLSREHIAQIRARLAVDAGELLAQEELRVGLPEKDIGHTDFYLAYHGLDERPLRELLARLYLHAYPGLRYRSPHLDAVSSRSGGKLRVGVVSSYLRTHTIGRLMVGLFRHLRRDAIDVTAFVFAPAQDAIAREIHAQCDRVVVLGAAVSAARQRIAEEKVDVLLYADIGMEPRTYFLAYARLAPVQCVTWGHPVTTGIPEMDYFVSSALIEPEGAASHYSERLVCLPDTCAHVCYAPPVRPDSAPDRARFGLDANAHLYYCPQTLFKLHPDFDGIISRILRADPAGQLLLIDHPPHLRAHLEARWGGALADVLHRIRFVPPCAHEEYLALLALADVALDTPHFSGGLSSLETLAMGTPVVALPGAYARSRLTLAAYRRMGIPDCVADTEEQYIAIALRLATDRAYRSAIANRILQGGSRLYNDTGTVRAWERFFVEAVERARGSGGMRKDRRGHDGTP